MAKGITQAETTILVKSEIEKYAKQINALGCGSEVGCMAGKRHFQEHANKFNSDINNLKEGQKLNETDKKVMTSKLSEAAIMFHEAVAQFKALFVAHNEAKEAQDKRMDRQDKRISGVAATVWGLALLIITLGLGALWTSNRIVSNVGKINTVDIQNQNSTEMLFKIIIEQLSGKNADKLISEYEKYHKLGGL